MNAKLDFPISGVIIADKPEGMSSFRVVSMVRKMTGVKRVGHSGTLDPFATGVLPICVGQATRVIRYLENDNKEYFCTIRFGAFSQTQDSEGPLFGGRHPTEDELKTMKEEDFFSIRRLFAELPGPLIQTPPIYSALKVNGQKACDLARKGIPVLLKPRTVYIYKCDILDIRTDPDLEVDFLITCSKGTYIRTICDEIGKKTGFGAYAIHLRRTRCGAFGEADAHTLEEIEQAISNGSLSSLVLPEEVCVRHLPALELTESEADHIRHGRLLPISDFIGRIGNPKSEGDRIFEQDPSIIDEPALRYRAMLNDRLIAVVYPEKIEDNIILKIERMLDTH